METNKIFRPTMMLPMDAAVYISEGVLVVNFEKPGKSYHCREVMIRHDEMGISVVGKRVSWAWNDKPEIAEFIADHVGIDKVLPEHLEVTYPIIHATFWRVAKALPPKTIVKTGWVELKETNILFHMTSNNYRITWKNPR